jgi:hypothetical protein
MNIHLIAKLGIVALVAVVAYLAASQKSGPIWSAVSAVALGGGVAVAVFYHDVCRSPRGRSAHGPKGR